MINFLLKQRWQDTGTGAQPWAQGYRQLLAVSGRFQSEEVSSQPVGSSLENLGLNAAPNSAVTSDSQRWSWPHRLTPKGSLTDCQDVRGRQAVLSLPRSAPVDFLRTPKPGARTRLGTRALNISLEAQCPPC